MNSKLPSMSNFVSLLPLLTAPVRGSLVARHSQVDFGSGAEGEDTEERVVKTWSPPVSQTRVERMALATRVGR